MTKAGLKHQVRAKPYKINTWPGGIAVWKNAVEAIVDNGNDGVKINTDGGFNLMMKLYRMRKALIDTLDPKQPENEWVDSLHFIKVDYGPLDAKGRQVKKMFPNTEGQNLQWVKIVPIQNDDLEMEIF